MGKSKNIEHKGIISEIRDGSIFVDLNVESACSSCHASGVCGVDSAMKTVEVRTDDSSFSIGDQVNVILRESLGMKALFLGYILPFVVLTLSLIILLEIGLSEGLSGLLSILLMGPYYLILYFFKDKIKREFNFNIGKI